MDDKQLFATSLEALEARVRHELELLGHPKGQWLPPRTHPSGDHVFDVLLVGAGQAGLAALAALRRENVTNTLAIDRNPAGREGPWVTYARMRTLRTHKDITGPGTGVPSLTPRAWYTARYGAEAWEALARFPRTDWQDYLDWFRRVLDLPVWNETEVGTLAPADPDDPDSLIRVPLSACGPSGRDGSVLAREVVLASGLEGSGVWAVPPVIADSLPADRYAQANTEIDFAQLSGKRIVVIGANAGGFDAAAVALESGAASVDLLVRRAEIPKVNAHRPIDSVTWLKHFADLDEDTRWRIAVHTMRNNQPPPQETFDRAAALAGFTMHEDAAIASARMDGGDVVIETMRGLKLRVDYVIAATGFVNDMSQRIETALIAEHAALWRDRYTPPADADWAPMGTYPYLGRDFEFTEKVPGTAPWLRRIHCFTLATKPSLGMGGGSATAMRYAIPRLVDALTRRLFLEDAARHTDDILSFDEPDLDTRPVHDRED
jgi:cation diffusion facilitator CzcD-associated flavoprotein CzcO